jgi:hypothetical protein
MEAGEEARLRLAPALSGQLLVAPVRLALAVAGLVAALVAGADTGPALLAFALGAFGFGVSILSAERAWGGGQEPAPAPPHTLERRLATLAAAVWPSTVGVAALIVVSVTVNATLTALLAGVEAGMGVSGLLTAVRIAGREQELGGRLLVDRRARAVYVDRTPAGG